MRLHAPDRLYEEVAFVAYHFHWDRETVLRMPHAERRRWCEEISDINERQNEDSSDRPGASGGIELTNPR